MNKSARFGKGAFGKVNQEIPSASASVTSVSNRVSALEGQNLDSRIDNLEAIRWDDMKAPATGLNPAGRVSPPTIDPDDGSLLFGGDESIAIWFQLPHSWLEGSELRPHLHWSKSTSATGVVDWQMKYKWANVGDVFPAFSVDVGGTEAVPNSDTADKHSIFEFPSLIDVTKKISSMLCIVLTRSSTNDTYAGDARLHEFDIHFQVDSNGSIQEFIK